MQHSKLTRNLVIILLLSSVLTIGLIPNASSQQFTTPSNLHVSPAANVDQVSVLSSSTSTSTSTSTVQLTVQLTLTRTDILTAVTTLVIRLTQTQTHTNYGDWIGAGITGLFGAIVALFALRRRKQQPQSRKEKDSKTKKTVPSKAFCIECGKDLPLELKFYNNCGTKQPYFTQLFDFINSRRPIKSQYHNRRFR